MKLRNYMKKETNRFNFSAMKERVVTSLCRCSLPVRRKIFFTSLFIIGFLFIGLVVTRQDFKEFKNSNSMITFDITSAAVTPSKTSVISIPSGVVKANPFLPYKEINMGKSSTDIPQSNLVAPPTTLGEDPDAIRVMDTIVSGILYDTFSPSAILNIEGNDYLVKKGDVVNNYSVLAITRDSVTVKLGANVYKAGIGQILTEGNLNHNDVANLKNKFGGDK